jgi:hypothetical protein
MEKMLLATTRLRRYGAAALHWVSASARARRETKAALCLQAEVTRHDCIIKKGGLTTGRLSDYTNGIEFLLQVGRVGKLNPDETDYLLKAYEKAYERVTRGKAKEGKE